MDRPEKFSIRIYTTDGEGAICEKVKALAREVFVNLKPRVWEVEKPTNADGTQMSKATQDRLVTCISAWMNAELVVDEKRGIAMCRCVYLPTRRIPIYQSWGYWPASHEFKEFVILGQEPECANVKDHGCTVCTVQGKDVCDCHLQVEEYQK